MLMAFCLIASMLVLWHTLHVIASQNVHQYSGHRLQFAALAGQWALAGAGGVAVAFGSPYGGPMLLAAFFLRAISDRRRL